jgi:hypothetical protein
MTVRCEGDCRIIDATWEKQDFEVLLTRQGYSHDDFQIAVQRIPHPGTAAQFSLRYIVTVRNTRMGSTVEYRGGLRVAWVGQFAVDLANGTFGKPERLTTVRAGH